jgi:hypothetical protein
MERPNLTNIADLSRWRQTCIECRARFQSILLATNELYTLQDQRLALQPGRERDFPDPDFKLLQATDRVQMARQDLSAHLKFSHGLGSKGPATGIHPSA